MIKNFSCFFIWMGLFKLVTCVYGESLSSYSQKVLICGVCRNVAHALSNTINNIEQLGSQFSDYAVIIYENNSNDNTSELLEEWAKSNPKITYLSENLPSHSLPLSRTEKIARARNIVLNFARLPKYKKFKFLVMADLDFSCPWPIHEIVKTIETPGDWDCVCANGVGIAEYGDFYFDTYALRDEIYPFGRELLGNKEWTATMPSNPRYQMNGWKPVYSAFGGLAIYKTASILPFSYDGVVTKNLEKYYQQIIASLPKHNHQLQSYLGIHRISVREDLSTIPIIFQSNMPEEHPENYPFVTVCEHVPLHASMAVHGFGKFYINLNMRLQY